MFEEQVERLPEEYPEKRGWGRSCWSFTKTCCSYVAVPFVAIAKGTVAAARCVRNLPTAVKTFVNNHPKGFRRYTAGFELLASPFDGVGLAIAADAFFDTSAETKYLGATLKSLIACVLLATLTGMAAARTHTYTNEAYGEGFHHATVPLAELSYARRAYIALISGGDFLEHAFGDISTLILWFSSILPNASLTVRRSLYACIIVASAIATIKEWSPCVKNILKYYVDTVFGEAEEVKASFLTVFTMVWSGLVALINGYSMGLLADSITLSLPVAAGLSTSGLVIWSLFGVGPSVASTFTHFLQQMAYDQHSGFSATEIELSRGGETLVSLDKALDFTFHAEEYYATPAQLLNTAMLNAKVIPHLRALALIVLGGLTAIAPISETGICFAEAQEGVAKLCRKHGIFQVDHRPTRIEPLFLETAPFNESSRLRLE